MKIFAYAKRFAKHERGATAVEYAMIAAGIAGVIIGIIVTLGGDVSNLWARIGNAIS